MDPVRRVALVLAVAGVGVTGGARAQRPDQSAAPGTPVSVGAFASDDPAIRPADGDGRKTPLLRRPWIRPLSSLVVPGTGQLLGGRDRGLAFLATELWLVARVTALNSQARRDRAQFQELAYRVARARFSASRVDGSFEYYESMTHFTESGVYDADPGPGFVPEPDPATYNGSVWLLARRTFFVMPDSLPPPGSAAYVSALAFYQSRAVGGEFQWSWRGARLEQDVFRGAIRSSDDAFRSATNFLGAIVVNHLVSAIDAFISVRTGGGEPIVPRAGVDPSSGTVQLLWGIR